uniref:Uncharacterized protein n=1 Tax=Arundo donax TaxID=35708 RepID=A0A0A9BWV5_ARUDO
MTKSQHIQQKSQIQHYSKIHVKFAQITHPNHNTSKIDIDHSSHGQLLLYARPLVEALAPMRLPPRAWPLQHARCAVLVPAHRATSTRSPLRAESPTQQLRARSTPARSCPLRRHTLTCHGLARAPPRLGASLWVHPRARDRDEMRGVVWWRETRGV